jgi:hypothetical protein
MPEPWEMIDAFQRGAGGLAPPSGAGLQIPYEQGKASVVPPPTAPPAAPVPLTLPPIGGGGYGRPLGRWSEPLWVPAALVGLFIDPGSVILALGAGLTASVLTVLTGRILGARVRLGRAFSASFFAMAAFLALNYGVDKYAGLHLPGLLGLAPGAAAFAIVNAVALRQVLPGVSGAVKSLLLSAATLIVLPMLCVEFIQFANHQKLVPPGVVLKDLAGAAQPVSGSRTSGNAAGR